jgi:ribosome-associated protein
LLRFAKVKKKERASRKKAAAVAAKGAKQSHAPKVAAKSKAQGGRGRFPVRGARPAGTGGGIRSRAAAEPAPQQPRRDVSDVRALAVVAMEAAMDKKALAPVLIDVSAMASYTDFIGIVSGRSDRQVDAIAESISQAMKSRGRHVLGQEGTGSGRWTLLDFGSFVVHVFHHPVREFYDLESLWIDAPRVKLDVPPESAVTQPDALYGVL